MDEKSLEYSFDASLNRTLFYSEFNDINIYVEDINKEYEYETVFKRLLGDEYRISSIFCMGGKIGVIKAFEENKKQNINDLNFYIVDGDFDRYIFPEKMIKDSHFIYLDTYNIENYYIDEEACYKFSKGKLRLIDDKVRKIINFDNWLNTIITQSSKLFLSYCFLEKYYPEIPSVSRKHCEFIDSKTGFERTDDAYNKYFENVIINADSDAMSKINDIDRDYKLINGDNYFNLICGKFLLCSLGFYLRSKINDRIDNDDLKWYLIENFDIKKLDYIKEVIQSSNYS